MRAARIACIALALVACAWFALGARQAIDTSRATAIVSGASTLTPHDEQHALSLLGDAGTLNPDREVDILRAAALAERDKWAAAKRILFAVTRAEPQNIEAWFALAARSDPDRRLFLQALARVAALEPRRPSS
jgi:predicted Zn-dependent protease